MKLIILFENFFFNFLSSDDQKKYLRCKKCNYTVKNKNIFKYTIQEGNNFVAICPVCNNDTFEDLVKNKEAKKS